MLPYQTNMWIWGTDYGFKDPTHRITHHFAWRWIGELSLDWRRLSGYTERLVADHSECRNYRVTWPMLVIGFLCNCFYWGVRVTTFFSLEKSHYFCFRILIFNFHQFLFFKNCKIRINFCTISSIFVERKLKEKKRKKHMLVPTLFKSMTIKRSFSKSFLDSSLFALISK